MSNPEGIAPDSIEAQALAELQKEGHEVGDHQPINDDGEVIEPKVEVKEESKAPETPKEEPKEPTKEPEKQGEPDRIPKMVEAWKLKVAENQKASAEQKAADLEAKLTELSKQKSPITEAQREIITDEFKALAEENGVDQTFLTKFADSILQKAEARLKPSGDIEQTLKELAQEKELAKQERVYADEFAKDIEPLVKEQYGLSDTALSQLKSQLKDLAFSDIYAKVPLAKIFKAEFDVFGLKEPKKSSEGKGVKVRSNEVVDYDNLTEEQFNNLNPEQIEEFSKRHSSGWNRL